MEPPKFSPIELAALIKEAVSWLKKQRDLYLPSSIALDDEQKRNLGPFFSPDNLSRARILNLSQSGEAIPYPPFYETFRAGGDRVLPDAAHMTALPFINVIAFNRQPTLRIVFHNLIHVAQFELL